MPSARSSNTIPTAVVTAKTIQASLIPPSVASSAAMTGEATACPTYTATISVAEIWANSRGPNAAVPTKDGMLAHTG